jgi:hypothetical protein
MKVGEPTIYLRSIPIPSIDSGSSEGSTWVETVVRESGKSIQALLRIAPYKFSIT